LAVPLVHPGVVNKTIAIVTQKAANGNMPQDRRIVAKWLNPMSYSGVQRLLFNDAESQYS
jgi:hypothetical protein